MTTAADLAHRSVAPSIFARIPRDSRPHRRRDGSFRPWWAAPASDNVKRVGRAARSLWRVTASTPTGAIVSHVSADTAPGAIAAFFDRHPAYRPDRVAAERVRP